MIICVDNLTARVVNLFSGQARTLPKNHLRRLYISDLTILKYFCTNRYLQNMQHKLYKQNKLTSSDQSQSQLLRKPSQTHIDVPYSNEEISKDEEADIDEELGCVNTAEDLTADKPEESNNTLDAIFFGETKIHNLDLFYVKTLKLRYFWVTGTKIVKNNETRISLKEKSNDEFMNLL